MIRKLREQSILQCVSHVQNHDHYIDSKIPIAIIKPQKNHFNTKGDQQSGSGFIVLRLRYNLSFSKALQIRHLKYFFQVVVFILNFFSSEFTSQIVEIESTDS